MSWTRRSRNPISALFVAVICLLLFITSTMSACSQGQRQDTIRGSLIAINAARDGFASWDLTHQQQIVDESTTREDAASKLANYRQGRAQTLAEFEVAYRLIAVAATQSDDLSLSAALERAKTLVDAVHLLMGANAASKPAPAPGGT